MFLCINFLKGDQNGSMGQDRRKYFFGTLGCHGISKSTDNNKQK